jgi:hypothetical protein
MTRTLHKAACALVVLMLGASLPASVQAQTQIDHTTFSAAVTAAATSVTLTAASGVVDGGCIYADGELMIVQGVSSTTATVRRGTSRGSTPARRHSTNALVWVGACHEFKDFNVSGACTLALEQYAPHINTLQNRIFDCAANGYWIERDPARVNVQSASTVCGGKLACREEFNGGHLVMQDDGTAKSVTDAEENFVYGSPLGAIEYREDVTKTTSSWVTINGALDISADDTAAEGVEIVFGASSDAALNQVIELGTHGACIAAMVTVTAIAGIDEFHIGWRQNEAFQDTVNYAGYNDWAVIGVVDTAGDLDAQDEEAGGGTQNDDTGITWADTERRALKVCISSTGVPTFYYTDANPDNEHPLYKQVTTTNTGDALTSGDGMIPFLAFTAAGTTDAGITIQWVELSYAP